MSKYLIKTIKLPAYISSGDHIREEDWLYVDPDKIHTINILGKEFSDISNIEAEPAGRINLQELEDRFGKYVRFVVEDMMSGEGKRWKND